MSRVELRVCDHPKCSKQAENGSPEAEGWLTFTLDGRLLDACGVKHAGDMQIAADKAKRAAAKAAK